ncbi:Uncharacterised protein [Halioglobus japonicus]|nr:Uncharacterised protein [Halioglobus japonicus]
MPASALHSRAHGKAAIAGVGYTSFSRNAPESVLELALTAVDAALADCGLPADAVDGILSYHLGDSVPVTTVARTLGLPRLRYHNEFYGGGSQCASILWDAAQAIESGLAETVVIYRALKGRSGKRMGQISHGSADGLEEQFVTPYGNRGPVNTFALTAQRWLHERQLGEDALASVAIAQRSHALNNERAMFREPLDTAQYFSAPMIASPLRRLDCCLETDGACALVITSTARARQLSRPPVRIHSAVRGGGPGGSYWDKAESLDNVFSHFIADELFRSSGMGVADIDLAYLYDAYTFLIPAQLEDFGFCRPGESIDFINSGETRVAGSLPVNSNGGMLSEGYVHGMNNIVEATLQLRGTEGARQLRKASTALCTGFGGRYGSAALLTADG